jgi:hypothetical protein
MHVEFQQTAQQQALERMLREREAGDDQLAEITIEQVIRIAQIISQTTQGGDTTVQLNAAWSFLTSVSMTGLGSPPSISIAEAWQRLDDMPIAVA